MKKGTIINSFKNAFNGIYYGVLKERNMMIHWIIMITVICCGLLFEITIFEWFICIILFALVIGGELFNTAIESVVDICSPDYSELAKIAKDTAAGAVLVFAISSAIIGLIIFVPYFIG